MAARERTSLLEFLFGEMMSAAQDIRGKLLDEGWFGRRAAPPSQFDVNPLGWDRVPERDTIWTDRTGSQRQSFEEAWAPREPGDAQQSREPDGHDIDR